MNRRQVVAAAGTGLIASLAGCGSNESSTEEPTSANPPGEKSNLDVAPPKADLPDGWKLTTPNTEPHVLLEDSIGPVDYTAVGHTQRFENKSLRNRLKEELFGEFDRPLVVGFATHVDLDIALSKYVEDGVLTVTDKVQSTAESEFRSRLESFGLQNLSEEGTYGASGEEKPAEFVRYSGVYPVGSVEIDNVEIPNVEKDSFTLKAGEIEVEGLLGVWHENESIFVAGGIFPTSNYRRDKEWEITGSVFLNLTVDMDLSPNVYRNNVVNFARSVHI